MPFAMLLALLKIMRPHLAWKNVLTLTLELCLKLIPDSVLRSRLYNIFVTDTCVLCIPNFSFVNFFYEWDPHLCRLEVSYKVKDVGRLVMTLHPFTFTATNLNPC